MDIRAITPVATGNGWSVGRDADWYDIRIMRDDGVSFFGTTVKQPATDDLREDAKDRLAEGASTDAELDRIEQAFAAPWTQA